VVAGVVATGGTTTGVTPTGREITVVFKDPEGEVVLDVVVWGATAATLAEELERPSNRIV
jgi:hypothetical protein